MQTRNNNHIYRNDLVKACFKQDMAYGKYKDLTKRTQSDKVLRDKAFEIASNRKYDRYQGGLAQMIFTFFDKKSNLILNLCQIKNLQMNFINQLVENLNEDEFILHLNTIFGVLFS